MREAVTICDYCCHMSHLLPLMASATDIPDEQTLSRVSDLTIYDSKGEGVKFGSLFEKDKTLVVFVRTSNSNSRVHMSELLPLSGHFNCGVCMMLDYCRWISQTLRISELPGLC
jgi:hypothetical protein